MDVPIRRVATIAFMMVVGLGSTAFLVAGHAFRQTDASPQATASSSVVIGPGTIPRSDLQRALDYFGSRFCTEGTLEKVTREASADANEVLRLEAGNDNLQGLLDAHKSGGDTRVYDVVLAGSCEAVDPAGRAISGAEMQFFVDASGDLVVSDTLGSYSGSEASPSPPFGDQFSPCESDGGCADSSPAGSTEAGGP